MGVREGEEGDVVLVMVSQSLRVCQANPTRPGEVEKKRGRRGAQQSRGRQCGFAMRLFLRSMFARIHDNMVSRRRGRRIPGDLAFFLKFS